MWFKQVRLCRARAAHARSGQQGAGLSGCTSAVGLLWSGLALAEADSGSLGAGEVLGQGHVEDLVVQRAAVCGDTGKRV